MSEPTQPLTYPPPTTSPPPEPRDELDEIRRRAGNRALTREELEYLNRLLERF